ncbi:MAG: hypothetical protein GXO62_08010 [Epsilonproteobacteria bacterium]|nr:hypothetical protein [Campylobacterota bacterium]
MKKLAALLIGSLLFASSADIDKKLDLLLQKLDSLEKKLNQKDEEIEKLKSELQKQQKEIKKQETITKKEFALKDCNKIRVVSLSYEYHDEVIPYYNLHIVLKNEYPYDIKYIKGSLFAEDKDRVKILQDYIDRNIDLPKGKEVAIDKRHLLNSELEKYLKDEKPENLKIYFQPTRVEFKNGKILKCSD